VPGFAQSSPEPFVPYKDFIANTKKAIPGDFIGHVDTKLDALARTIDADRPVVSFRVQDEAKFEEMRQAVLARYQDVEVSHSFMIGTQHYDCVPVMQQPAVRNYHLTEIATPPPSVARITSRRMALRRVEMSSPLSRNSMTTETPRIAMRIPFRCCVLLLKR
jgi:hypothetical protein